MKFWKLKNKKKILKSNIFTIISLLVSSIFMIGFLFGNHTKLDFDYDAQKWTTHSNAWAFFTVLLYLIRPKLRIFKTNILLSFSGIALFIAGFGFWVVLFPTTFIGLSDYVVSQKSTSSLLTQRLSSSAIFFWVWNHTITPVFYYLFLISAYKKSSDIHLKPAKIRHVAIMFYTYLSVYILIFVIIFPLTTNFFPVYGIFTNSNPHTPFKLKDNTPLYSWKIVAGTIIGIYLISYIMILFNWRVAIQLNPTTRKNKLKHI